eukprot:SAG11_NODE_51564_length_109_cov_174.400000_1_plen_27_part_01
MPRHQKIHLVRVGLPESVELDLDGAQK